MDAETRLTLRHECAHLAVAKILGHKAKYIEVNADGSGAVDFYSEVPDGDLAKISVAPAVYPDDEPSAHGTPFGGIRRPQ